MPSLLSRLQMSDDHGENSIMQTITIAVSAILIAAGLVTAPGLINNARDNNATTDLANISYGEATYLAENGKYTASIDELNRGSVKITKSGDSQTNIFTGDNCFGAFSKSTSGKYFYTSSEKSGATLIGTTWSATKPADYPVNCQWPSTSKQAVGSSFTNLMPNPGFEAATIGSVIAPGSVTYSKGTVGTNGNLTFKRTSTADPFIMLVVPAQANAGDTFTWKFDIWTDSPTPVNAEGFFFRLPNDISLMNTRTSYSVSSAKQTVTITGKVPAGTSGSEIQLIFRPVMSDTYSTYVDNVMLLKGNYSGSYFDGNSANAQWSGTPNASTSTLSTEK
jgi:hypothetical protein